MTRYRTIVADPPWAYTSRDILSTTKTKGSASAVYHYPAMTDDEIAALDVASFVEDDAHLYLWVTNPRIWVAPSIVDAWGFEYRTLITWVKEGSPGLGYWFRGQTEHVVFATRGKAPIPPSLRERNMIVAPRGRHSEKPDAFMDMVERVSPAPRLEMFSRRARFGWDTWGNESLEHVEMTS